MPEQPIRASHEAVHLDRLVVLSGCWRMPLSSDPILQATIRILRRRGYQGLTTKDVIRAARVGRTEFYRRYTGKHDCFLAAYAVLLEEFELQVADEEFRQQGEGKRSSVGSWLSAVASVLDSDHRMAQVLVLDAEYAGSESLGEVIAQGIAGRAQGDVSAAQLTMTKGSLMETCRSYFLAESRPAGGEHGLRQRIAVVVESTLPSQFKGRLNPLRQQPRGQVLDFKAAAARRRASGRG